MAISQLSKRFYEFGPFSINSVQRVLLREGEVVTVTPKQFDLLLLLVENHGRIVEKERLMEEIWPDTARDEVQFYRVFYNRAGITGEDLPYLPDKRRGYRAKQRNISLYGLAETYARLGDKDQAFLLLEKPWVGFRLSHSLCRGWDLDFRTVSAVGGIRSPGSSRFNHTPHEPV